MFLLGVLLCSAFLILMSQFIWAMEFDGNRMITEEELKRYLEDEGIRYGTPRHFFSAETLEKGLREAFEEITWASVSLQGTKLVVKIQEDIRRTLLRSRSCPNLKMERILLRPAPAQSFQS